MLSRLHNLFLAFVIFLSSTGLQGEVEFVTSQGVEVDVKSGSSIDVLAQQPGLEWLGDLKNRTDVKWNRINEAHEHWDYSSQGLTSGAAAVISLAIGVATYGAGTGISAGISAGVGGGTMGATMGAMGSAAFSTLVSRASISMINNGGDLGKVMQDLGSRESLRSLATVIISAGIVGGVTSGLELAPSTTGFMERVTNSAVRTGVNTMVDSTIGGHSFEQSLQDNLLTGVIDVGVGYAAQEIGIGYKTGELTRTEQMTLHGLTGGVSGTVQSLVRGENVLTGAVSGIGGSLVGEFVGNQLADHAKDQGLEPDTGDSRWSGLTSGTVAFLAGGDVSIASRQGELTSENNALLILPLIYVGMKAWDYYETAQDVQKVGEGLYTGDKNMAVEGGIGLALGLSPIPGKGLVKCGGRQVQKGVSHLLKSKQGVVKVIEGVKKVPKVTREKRWQELAKDHPNKISSLPKEVKHFIRRHKGRKITKKFGLELAHKPKKSNIQGYDYSEALPKTGADHRGIEHKYLRETREGSRIGIPKSATKDGKFSVPHKDRLPK